MTKNKIICKKVSIAIQNLFKEGLCERCITHRFAVHLEKQNFGEGYFVDCEYNKAHLSTGGTVSKRVSNPNGNYIDIIITKRDGNSNNNLVCFEIKKKKNYRDRNKDRENLEILTGGERFGYKIGFYIILGNNLSTTRVEIYENGIKK